MDGRNDQGRSTTPAARRCGRPAPAMTACACAGALFAEVVHRLREGQTLDEAQAATGIGLLCTACLPDLREHLSAAETEPVEPAA